MSTHANRTTAIGAVMLVTLAIASALAQSNAAKAAPALNGVPVFDADPKWPVLPSDWSWGQVIGIFADTSGHVWTSSRSRISEWDPQGKLLQSWDARGPDGNWSTIHGLFVDHDGFVWTNARESHLTVKFTRTGQVALVIGKYNQTGGSNDTMLMGRPSEIWATHQTTKSSWPMAMAIAASSCSRVRVGAICVTGVHTGNVQRILRLPPVAQDKPLRLPAVAPRKVMRAFLQRRRSSSASRTALPGRATV